MQKELPKHLPPRDTNSSNQKSYKYIPKKIFHTWGTNQVTPGMYDAVHTWIDKNPDWEYYFFDDKACRDFIKENFPKKVLDAYDTLIPGAYKADLWRYCVLYIHGGVSVDIKAQLLVGLNDVIAEDIQFLSIKDRPSDSPNSFLSTYILQAFLCAKPKHPFLKKAIDLIVTNVEAGDYGHESISITGPGVIGKAINMVLNRPENTPNLSGEHNINDYKYTLWPHSPCLKEIKDGFNNSVFKYEYPTYREELNSSFQVNIGSLYEYCWYFDKVYTHNKVIRPAYNAYHKKEFKRNIVGMIRKLYKAGYKKMARQGMFNLIKKGNFKLNLIMIIINYELLRPVSSLFKKSYKY